MNGPDAATAHLAADLLGQGERLDRLSRPLTVLAAVAAPTGAALGLSAAWVAVAATVAVLGLPASYAAARCALDAALFRRLAEDGRDAALADLDSALARVFPATARKSGRPLGARVRGALRLLRLQAALLLAQIAVLLAAATMATHLVPTP